MSRRIFSKFLFRGFRLIAICMASTTLLGGCAKDYVMTETWNPVTLERTFYHEMDDGPNVGLIARQMSGGREQVGVAIVNDGVLPLTVPMNLTLYVDGEKYYGEKGQREVIVDPGAEKRVMCKIIFRSLVTRPVINQVNPESSRTVNIYKSAKTVYVTLGPYRSPEVIVDLTPENQVPVRFAESP